MKKQALFLSLAVAAVLFVPGLSAAEEIATPASLPSTTAADCGGPSVLLAAASQSVAPAAVPELAKAPPPGTCCFVEFAKCARRCRCGVFEFNCTLDFPGCTANCVCNICP
jgi:hypothetical protein